VSGRRVVNVGGRVRRAVRGTVLRLLRDRALACPQLTIDLELERTRGIRLFN
jgi:hypothetical protein